MISGQPGQDRVVALTPLALQVSGCLTGVSYCILATHTNAPFPVRAPCTLAPGYRSIGWSTFLSSSVKCTPIRQSVEHGQTIARWIKEKEVPFWC
jgi:hypothetical protein